MIEEHWILAIKEEMKALEKNSTWDIIHKSKDKKIVGCRMISIRKHKVDGTVDIYKVRLVAKEYIQTGLTSMRMVWEIYLDNDFFVIQIHLTILLVYVDDMIIISDDEEEKLTLKKKLATQFEMKDLGKMKYFLGIEVAYSNKGIFISQSKYFLDLFNETRKLRCRILRVQVEQNHKIGSEKSSPMEKYQYKKLVGKLIYLSRTRPNIVYVVSVVNQFMHDS
uniref:Reverse transcriptase Ty1/copia-type domain-containing protein n=1 Tax=Cajanus cajan TaxID=3821 RepID=A0A151U4H9_CAJCA|nr:hypothetical protein KK1_006832 [Cajanus cajan]